MVFYHKRYFRCRVPEDCCCKKERKIDYEYYKRLSRQYASTSGNQDTSKQVCCMKSCDYEDSKKCKNYDPNKIFIITP